ncbi:RNA-binding protein Nova-1 [Trichuris trichiura]|uniref:RNA-binding protein Nova-1 n=1 Tax=Trichuris trichiura TaxID=36087 RepID=A0A077ZE09_TRITR|nr:RNA-binding protein Nova-1 [Trichuris trichiura]
MSSGNETDDKLSIVEESDERDYEGCSRKRPVESQTVGSPDRAKRSNVTSSESVMVKLLVPAAVSGAIIGRHGETIANLQQDTKTHIKLSKSTELFPGTSERVLSIVGAKAAIVEVCKFVADTIKDKHNLNSKNDMFDFRQSDRAAVENVNSHSFVFICVLDFQMKIVVADSTAGIIIGKAGEQIKMIKEQTGVLLKISHRDASHSERVVTIAGHMDDMLNALEIVLQKVASDPHAMTNANVSYGSTTANGSKSELSSLLDVGFNSSIAGGRCSNGVGAIVSTSAFAQSQCSSDSVTGPFIENLASILNSRGFGEMAVLEIVSAVQVLAKYNVLGMAFHTNIGRSSAEPFNCFYQSDVGIKSDNRPVSVLDRNLSPLASMEGSSEIPPSDLVRLRSESLNKVELEVPDDIVGAVLGRNGDTLFEIQHKSGAKVEVSQRSSYAPFSKNRIVSISGSSSQISKARAAVTHCVNREHMRRKFRDHTVSQK